MWFFVVFLSLLSDGTTIEPECPPLAANLTNEEFVTRLTDPCRYDKLSRPSSQNPLKVSMQIDLSHIHSLDQLQFKAHMLVQYIYLDEGLKYGDLSPEKGTIVGKDFIKNRIWLPDVNVGDEENTRIMGVDGSNVFISLSPDGEVVYSLRLITTFYCWMHLEKFPFDYQECSLKWSSWAYNTNDLLLVWDKEKPVELAKNLYLTEFLLKGTYTEQNFIQAPFNKGAFVGLYSQLIFRFKLSRNFGFYLMDYFLPSILLVVTSWVSFWLQADAAPPRILISTSTMLAFITLNGALSKSLPKVSYVKASEIWFFVCACFIFLSMVEFTFVNIIWRRQKKVHVKKKNSKYILQGALTPRTVRKQLKKHSSLNDLYRTRSCSSLEEKHNVAKTIESNYLTVHSFPSSLKVPTITRQSEEEDSVSIQVQGEEENVKHVTWHTMTPHEVAIWIDRKSRIVFPVSFLIFNIFYWSFVFLI